MKIIQLNIWGGKLGQQIINFLQAEQPDFVCMQEVNDLPGRSGYKFFATFEEIKTEAGFSEAAMAPTYASRYMERELNYGNAILSKQPIVSAETIFTCGAYRRDFDVTKDDGNIRNFQRIIVDIDGQPLHILNHHGYWIYGTKAGNKQTLDAMQLITDTIKTLEGPIILCGDFNLAPDSQSIAIINEQLTNLTTLHKLKSTYSELSVLTEVCDYIFVNGQVSVRNFAMSKQLVSDHQALILEFEF